MTRTCAADEVRGKKRYCKRNMALLAVLLFLCLQAPAAPTDQFAADGLKALEQKNYVAAVELFTKALAADPADYSAHFNLALAYSLLDRDREAVASYRKVLELKPGLYQAELNL